MLAKLIDRIGDSNPQLWRELKGHLTGRNLIYVLSASLLIQGSLLLAFSETTCTYKKGICTRTLWHYDWLPIFRTLDWIFPLTLFSIGVYTLVADVVRERRKGTLNFIRLSPQSSENILLGKILGVPCLVYLGILLAMPLHVGAGIAAGVPVSWIIAFYALIVAASGFLSCAALLNVSLTQAPYQAIASSFLGAWLGSSFIGLLEFQLDWNSLTYNDLGDWGWFVFSLGNRMISLNLWMLITVSVASYWLWVAANRLFRNPYGTMLSKEQSYWLVGSFQIWLLGLFWSQVNNSVPDSNLLFGCLFGVSVISLILLLCVIYGISPQRQQLLDWARYDRFNSAKSWLDWIKGKRSPATMAIALNLAMTGAIWLPWVLLFNATVEDKIKAIAGLLLSANLIWFYAVLAQLVFLSKRGNSGAWALSVLSLVILLPIFLLLPLENKVPGLWMFSAFGSGWMLLEKASMVTIFFSLLGQWALMVGTNLYLTKHLQRVGESATKQLYHVQ
ncbi:MAG TPA: hypothetical protein DEG17_26495 [Cyanobacteria bacterium UBA11149]|nr:hypothetical protein [Cyanobacteria bacterium UBA11367]HBE59713.1 hypothetical protein [Cyanobacteria bacterium UBA11366]HBR76069.1 hypothetical protein [Cyanobacteria bacterium UBA11159]HBS72669.1 hypothetical protein [Cyanobacteria bacterium UBA11153]HBW92319.1 hypothetical protein [Cyanobacteria bacterium UBA11149]HCA96161.1 hypothetical protein [Cyanobacteria bacterium UBA9226]